MHESDNMIEIKGFAGIPALENNAIGATATVGELSTYAKSYSRDRRMYLHADGEVNLTTLYCKRDEVSIVPESAHVKTILDVISWVHRSAEERSAAEASVDFVTALSGALSGAVEHITRGPLVRAGSGGYYPDRVSFTIKALLEDHLITVWFSDASFRNQYDKYEIYVVSPLPALDGVFAGFTAVSQALRTQDPGDVFLRAQAVAQDHPYTALVPATYDLVNPNISDQTYPTLWAYVVHGPAGNNVDALRQATIDHIAKNSRKTIADWKKIFPSIFLSTEMIVIPAWSKMAIAEQTLQAGVNSSTVTLSAALTYLAKTLSSVDSTFVLQHSEVTHHPFYNLALYCVGSPDNRAAMYRFSQIYPDFISVASTSPDFARMSPLTQEYSLKLTQALVYASDYVQGNVMSSGFGRSTRAGIEFVTFSHNRITTYVATRASAPKE